MYYHDPEDLDGKKGKPTTPSGGKGTPGPGKGKGKDHPKPVASADQIAEWLQIHQRFGDS